MSDGLIPQLAPCFVSHNLALGGAQTAVLRMIDCLPEFVQQRTTLYVQSHDTPLLDAAVDKHGFWVGDVTYDAPEDPSSWILSYGDLRDLPQRPTSLILHSWNDEGWRYIDKTYGHMRGLRVAGVSNKVLDRYDSWNRRRDNDVIGVLPPPVTEFAMRKGDNRDNRIVVTWMGRPLESKGLMSLPYLLAMDKRIVVRAWTGAETAGLDYTRRVQADAMRRVTELAHDLGVIDRLDIRPLDFDAFAYGHRLEGSHVLLGNSECEGFLLTAAEALSCGVPVVVTRTCGVADFVRNGHNGILIDWDEDPQALAKQALPAIKRAAKLDAFDCLKSVETLSTGAGYIRQYGDVLAQLTHSQIHGNTHNPRVTVGVRIHQGTRVECLDEAINSVMQQTYRDFKVVLLVDGPWSWGEQLSARYGGLPLICTGLEADITHCSWLHRQAVAQCDTEFYKPLDYDDQMLPGYLERAVATIDEQQLDVYGCKLLTLEDGQIKPRLHWPNKPLESMFTGNSDDNMLPHSSVLLRTEKVREAGNYQERAVGLGADDYHLWYRLHKVGAKFYRDDDVRHVVYRIHDGNSLPKRRARYGGKKVGRFVAGAAAASLALAAGQSAPTQAEPPTKKRDAAVSQHDQATTGDRLDPPHS